MKRLAVLFGVLALIAGSVGFFVGYGFVKTAWGAGCDYGEQCNLGVLCSEQSSTVCKMPDGHTEGLKVYYYNGTCETTHYCCGPLDSIRCRFPY